MSHNYKFMILNAPLGRCQMLLKLSQLFLTSLGLVLSGIKFHSSEAYFWLRIIPYILKYKLAESLEPLPAPNTSDI